MAKKIEIKKVQDFGDLVSAPFYYIRQHFRSLGKSILYFVVPLIAVAGIAVSQLATTPFTMDPEDIESGAYIAEVIASSLSGSIFGILAMTALAAVVYHHIKLVADETVDNDSIEPQDIWPGVKSDFLMLLLISLGVGLATGIGIIFFILPGIFISIKLVLTTAVYVIEDVDFGDAFSRSWHLVTNHWWYTFGLVVVMYIFASLMTNAITFPFVIVSFISGFSGLENPETMEQTMGPVFSIFYGLSTSLSYVFYTIVYICLGMHYYNLIERKEGKELTERIDQIDNSAEA